MEQIDLNLNFDYDAENRRIINVTFDDSEYKQLDIETWAHEHNGDLQGIENRVFEPQRQGCLQALQFQHGAEYCTKPVSKVIGDMAFTVCLGLEKR